MPGRRRDLAGDGSGGWLKILLDELCSDCTAAHIDARDELLSSLSSSSASANRVAAGGGRGS